MKSWKIILLTGAFALTLLAAIGCGSDPVAPQETIEIDAATAEQWSIQAIDMINQMAWVMNQTVTFSEGEPPTSIGETRISVWIQFRNLEGPMQTPPGATEMEYRQALGMTMHNEDEQGVSDIEFDLNTGMLVTYLDTGYGMNGTLTGPNYSASGTESVPCGPAPSCMIPIPR